MMFIGFLNAKMSQTPNKNEYSNMINDSTNIGNVNK